MGERHLGNSWVSGLVLLALVGACGKGDGPVKPKGHEVAGEVVAVEGTALARWFTTTDANERDLEVGGVVFADDTIVTTAGSSITIRITHNQVLWTLGGDKRVALAESASWNASKASGEALLASGPTDETAVAGRHAERSAAGTSATASRAELAAHADEPTSATAMPPTAPPPPAPTETPPPPPAPGGSVGDGSGAGSGSGAGYGYGQGDGHPRKSPPRKTVARQITLSATPVVQGGLDKEVVQSRIKANQAQIRYCYEKALTDKVDLAGKVVVRFTITGQGAVGKVGIIESKVDDAALERCIVAKIKSWKFPAPKDGGEVTVTYPFLFQRE